MGFTDLRLAQLQLPALYQDEDILMGRYNRSFYQLMLQSWPKKGPSRSSSERLTGLAEKMIYKQQ